MEDRGAGQGAFDERAALEELERLRGEIERRRAAREAAAGRFDAFIRSFQKPAASASVEPAAATFSIQGQVPPPQAVPAPPVEIAPVEEPSPSSAAPQKRRVRTRALVASVLLLPALGALGLWAWRQQPARVDVAPPGAAVQRSADPPNTRASEPPIDRPTAPVAAPAEPAPAPAATQLEIEITTTRGVWVRVLSDGERVLERELPAEARVPVTAKQSIVVRAGDTGP
ncbi:MAG: hypothetical protein WD227_13190, partial [Vicinamibacterales bacterium]